MPRLSFQTHEEAAAFAQAIGFGEDFFGSGRLTLLVEQYKTDRQLDAVAVEVVLRDETRFLAALVQVAQRYLVFHTQDRTLVCVPPGEVARVTVRPRTPRESGGQPGFSVERIDDPPAAES